MSWSPRPFGYGVGGRGGSGIGRRGWGGVGWGGVGGAKRLGEERVAHKSLCLLLESTFSHVSLQMKAL